MNKVWKTKSEETQDKIDWLRFLRPDPDLQWWEYPLRGMEQTFETIGTIASYPFRKPFREWLPQGSPLPGGEEHEEYREWKGRQKPLWQAPGWMGMVGEMTEITPAEVYELAPTMFLGAGAAKQPLQKIGQQITKQAARGKPLEEAARISFGKGAKKGWMPKYPMGEAPEAPITEAVTALEIPKPPEIPQTKSLTKTFLQLPERTLTSTAEQRYAIHQLAKAKNIPVTGAKQQYKKILKLYTGKTSATQLTRDEADMMVGVMEGLKVNAKGRVVIPKAVDLVPKEIFESIPMVQDMGLFKYVRQVPTMLKLKFGTWGREMVWDLLGVEVKYNQELAAYRQTSNNMVKMINNNPQSKTRIFKSIENPLDELAAPLNDVERKVYDYFRGYFDDWANKLNLPAEKRRNNYITHIFDAQIKQDFEKKRASAMELMAALDFRASSSVFMPYFKERTGAEIGLKLDPFAAADAYEYYALKKIHYEPLIRKFSAMARMLRDTKPIHARYLEDVIKDMSGRPSLTQIEMNHAFKSFVNDLSKVKGLEKLIPEGLKDLASKGNFSALVAHNINSLIYMSWLGLRPVSAIRNLSQQLLAVSLASPGDFASGLSMRMAKKLPIEKSLVYQGRLTGEAVAGLEEATLSKLPRQLQKWSLSLFKWADKQNVVDSFAAGYAKGKRLGLPEDWCVKLGDEIAAETQYLYTRQARSLFERSAFGRFITPFTSWPRNFMEYLVEISSGRPSIVLQEYERQTGNKVLKEGRNLAPLMTYAAILAGAYVTEGLTPIRATEYTGWTSVKNLARMLGGEIPMLKIYGSAAQLVAGLASNDETMVKKAVSQLRPDRLILILKQLEDIAEGKADAASLFFYLEQHQAEERARARPTRARPSRSSRTRR